MKIQGYEVQVKSNGVQVGCTFVPLDKMEELVKQVKEAPSLAEKLMEAAEKDLKNVQLGIAAAAEFTNTSDLMQVRKEGEYAYQGFFLGVQGWRVVKDSSSKYVLLPPQ